MEAQRSRGLKTGSKNPFTAVRSFVPVVIPLILRSMVTAEFLATAITSRGFGATTHPISLRETKISVADIVATSFFLVLLVVAILTGTWVYNLASFKVTTFLIRNAFFRH